MPLELKISNFRFGYQMIEGRLIRFAIGRLVAGLFIPAIAALFISCSEGGLPGTPPDDFVVELHTDGGMIPNSSSVRISKDSSRYTLINEGKSTTIKYANDPASWENLYNVLRENEITLIAADLQGEAFDRDGDAVTVRWKEDGEEKSYRISDAGNSFVREVWRGNYTNVVKAINAFNGLHADPFYLDFEVMVRDNSQTLEEADIYLDGKRRFTWPQDTSARKFRILPGKYDFAITATQSVRQVDREEFVAISKDSKGVDITFLKDSVEIAWR